MSRTRSRSTKQVIYSINYFLYKSSDIPFYPILSTSVYINLITWLETQLIFLLSTSVALINLTQISRETIAVVSDDLILTALAAILTRRAVAVEDPAFTVPPCKTQQEHTRPVTSTYIRNTLDV